MQHEPSGLGTPAATFATNPSLAMHPLGVGLCRLRACRCMWPTALAAGMPRCWHAWQACLTRPAAASLRMPCSRCGKVWAHGETDRVEALFVPACLHARRDCCVGLGCTHCDTSQKPSCAVQVLATLSSDPELASMNQKALKQTGERTLPST